MLQALDVSTPAGKCRSQLSVVQLFHCAQKPGRNVAPLGNQTNPGAQKLPDRAEIPARSHPRHQHLPVGNCGLLCRRGARGQVDSLLAVGDEGGLPLCVPRFDDGIATKQHTTNNN